MRHLLLFESYIDTLNEVRYSDYHYPARTSLDNPISRVVPYSPNYKSGFLVDSFVDEKDRIHSIEDIEDIFGVDRNTINNYISKALNLLTNSQKLANWFPKDKKAFHMLDLGRICFYDYPNRYYPILKPGNSKTGGFYDGGDRIWAMVRGDDFTAVTIKYYESTYNGKRSMFNDFARNAKLPWNKFQEVSSYGYPYGKNFEVLIDLFSDESEREIMLDIKNQIEGI